MWAPRGTTAMSHHRAPDHVNVTSPWLGGDDGIAHGAHAHHQQQRERMPGAGGQAVTVVLRGLSYEVAVVDPKRLRSGESAGAHQAGAAEIVSPMPGKIVRVLVRAGDKVEAGAGIIVVEAMKMQNEMKAPKAGSVVSINAEEGATVNAGDVLAVVE